MIDVKEAVRRAAAYFSELSEAAGHQVSELELEEVEKSGDNRLWFITLGYWSTGLGSPLIPLSSPKKAYKRFSVDAGTGEVVSMTIREVHVP